MAMSWLSRYIFHPLWDLKDGSKRLRVLNELEKSQWCSARDLYEMQSQRAERIVKYAGRHSPYYESLFHRCGFDVTAAWNYEKFRQLPLLTKADIRANSADMISSAFSKERLGSHKTGGSTGVSLQTYFDKAWLETRTGDALRADQWANCFHGMKIAAVWGNPPVADTFKKKLRKLFIDRFIYLDTMNLTDKTMLDFVRLWRREHPEIVFGHSHSIYIFARFLIENGIEDLRPSGIISTSMMLLPTERSVIEEAFSCKVTDRYGCEEVGLIASECEQHSGYHLNIEHLLIEFIRPDGQIAQPGEEGAIVVTDLLNIGMPLIRYRVEDIGVPSDRSCTCGRGLPLMERVIGRVADYLKRLDGSLVAGVSLVERTLTAIDGIEQMQIEQPTRDTLILRIVRASSDKSGIDKKLLEEFKDVFTPEMKIRIENVDRIPQERSGKYRFSICRV